MKKLNKSNQGNETHVLEFYFRFSFVCISHHYYSPCVDFMLVKS